MFSIPDEKMGVKLKKPFKEMKSIEYAQKLFKKIF